MSLTPERMLDLMAYADGELEDAERDEVEAWIASDPDAGRFAAELGTLGDLVREGHAGSPSASAVATFDVADVVVAAAFGKDANVAPIAKGAPPARVVPLAARRRRSFGAGAVVAGALALAASVLVLLRGEQEVPMAQAPSPAPVAVASAELGVEVEPVESEGESVQVFYLANESSPTASVVVWVDEPGAH